MGGVYVPGKGSLGAKMAFVGEAPSYEEEEALEPFVGPAGREFDKLLREAGISRGDYWITNVSKYRVPPNAYKKKIPFAVRAKSAGIDLDQQIAELRKEIYSINPNIIVCLGGTALWALTGKESTNQGTGTVSGTKKRANSGISDWRGSLILGFGKKCISTYHPAHLLYQDSEVKGYWNRQVMIFDLKRAKAQSIFPELQLPSRNLYVCRDSNQFQDFISRYKEYKRPAVDIEVSPNGIGIPICVGIAFTKHEGITIPLWNVDEICSLPDSDMVQLWLLLAELLANHDIVGQNFKYDQDKIRRIGFVIRRLASDTMLKAFAVNPELPKNLSFNTSIYTEEPFYKHEGMYEGSIRDLLIGCARDACVTKEIDDAMNADIDQLGMRDYYENFILKLHDLYLDIESVGFGIDANKQVALLRKYIAWDERLNYERYVLCGHEVNPGSPKQVAALLYDQMKISRREGTGEEILTALLGQVKKDDQRAVINNILEARRVRKTIDTYLMAPADFDGRMKTTYFPCLETGRSSTGQLEPPIRPIQISTEKGKKKKRAIGMAFQTITKHGDVGEDIRSMFVP